MALEDGVDKRGTTGGRARRAVRMRDVAELAGVDVSTVSRVLNPRSGRTGAGAETRQRIFDAAAALDFRPNSAARTLKTAQTMTIGLLLPDLFNIAYAAIAEGAEERALATDYTMVITTGAVADRVRALEGRADGLMIATAVSSMSLPPEVQASMPLLLVNRRERLSVPSITIKDEDGAAIATRHLASLGHKVIAHAAGPQNTDTARRRKQGYLAAMAQAGLEVTPGLVVDGPYSESGGHAATSRLLELSPRPTAIFAATLTMAIGAMSAIRSAGLRIPEDVSVVGYDDLPLAMYLDPPLTTVRMPLQELGSEAVDVMIRLIHGETVGDVVLGIRPELVLRGSSGAPPA